MSSLRDFNNMGSPSKYFWQQLSTPTCCNSLFPFEPNSEVQKYWSSKNKSLQPMVFLGKNRKTNKNKKYSWNNPIFICPARVQVAYPKTKCNPDNCADYVKPVSL